MIKLAILLSLLFGLPLAAFVAASPFYPMDLSIWRVINNALVIATLGGVAILGWKLRTKSWSQTGGALLCYTSVLTSLFMGAYLTTTWFFADDMKWVPFFQRDYLYHNYSSVKAYFFAGDNYVELARLNLFSWIIFSIAYVGLGGLAAAASRRFGRSQQHSAQSGTPA